MPRFFVSKDQFPIITGSDIHHLKDVLRMKIGDQLELLDGTGKVYHAEISKITRDKIACKILSEKIEDTDSKIKVTIAQALPKGRKMDFMIEKCTELGVHRIIPIITERSVAKSTKLERWQKIAKESAEQCGRAIIPEIAPLTKLEEVLKLRNQFDLGLTPWELEKKISLKQALKDFLISQSPNIQIPITQSPNILILIGPEGGFSQKEIESAEQAGFTPITLGKRILRTETAGIAILAMINYELEK